MKSSSSIQTSLQINQLTAECKQQFKAEIKRETNTGSNLLQTMPRFLVKYHLTIDVQKIKPIITPQKVNPCLHWQSLAR
jgi:hypothetical protein